MLEQKNVQSTGCSQLLPHLDTILSLGIKLPLLEIEMEEKSSLPHYEATHMYIAGGLQLIKRAL